MCAAWRKEYDPSLITSSLISMRKIKEDGKVIFTNIILYEDCISVLLSSIEFSEKLTEIDKIRIVHSALHSATKINNLTPKLILREITKAEKSFITQKPKSYALISTISIEHFAGLTKTAISGCTICFFKYLPKKYDQSKFIKIACHDFPRGLPKNYAYAKINVEARSEDEAVERALESLDLIRGIWNYFYNKGSYSFSPRGLMKPVNEILLGPLHTLHYPNGNPASDRYWYEPEYREPIDTKNISSEWMQLKKYEKNIRNRLNNSNYRQFMEQSFVRYVRALDEFRLDNAFLKLWSLIEFLTDTVGGKYDQTIKRVLFLCKDRPFHQQVLKHLREYRNRSIHFDYTSLDIRKYIFQLKRYVEGLLGYHLQNIFKAPHLQDAASILDLPTNIDDLKHKICCFRKALRFHSI